MAKRKDNRAVIICTEFRGVFFGYTDDTSGDVVSLTGARNCLYWSTNVGGVLGLANTGPNGSCKIGTRADIELRKVTAVIECTPEAVTAWEAAATVK